MTRTVKVLHLASFSGNIGDNINHLGFRPWFERMLGRPVEWCALEMREFYWKERAWDEHFVTLANSHDLLIVGGGNYFELWVENSSTGVSFGLPTHLLGALRVPVFFNALGLDAGQGLGLHSEARFRAFLDFVLAAPQFLVSLRNDGSWNTAQRLFGANYAARIGLLPDGGFFAPVPDAKAQHIASRDPIIAVNLACDMGDIRFTGFGLSGGMAEFANEMAAALGDILAVEGRCKLVFVPHVYHDLDIIALVLRALPDRLRRTRVSVAEFGSGPETAEAILALYQQAELVLGMRFHANVGAIAAGSATLGLKTYPQIGLLYEDIGVPEQAVDVARPGFREPLVQAACQILQSVPTTRSDVAGIIKKVSGQRAQFEPALLAWMHRNNLA